MSVHVLYDSDEKVAALYCSTSGHAFGPIFNEDPKSEWTAAETAEFFLRWLPRDAREYQPGELEEAQGEFLRAKPVECAWFRCGSRGRRGDRLPKAATAYDYFGHPNKAHADGYCSEECRDAAAEDGDERSRDAYYGASTPQTEAERGALAATAKARFG